MDLTRINEVLGSLNHITLKKVSDNQPSNYWDEKYDGTTSQREVVYDLEDGSGLFLKVTHESDSYGNNEAVVAIKFVQPTTKTVTVYE